MKKHLIKGFAVIVSFLAVNIAVAGVVDDCLPIDYQELKDLPQEVLQKELCSAKQKFKLNKAVGNFDSKAAEMYAIFKDVREVNKNNESAGVAYRAAAICEKQLDRIQRQLVQKGVAEEAIDGLCPASVK